MMTDASFNYLIVNHTYNLVNPHTGSQTQNVERLWGSSK